MKTDTKQRDVLHGKHSSTGKVLDVTTAILGHAVIRLMPQTHKEIVFHFCTQFHHTQWSNGWSRSYFVFFFFFFWSQMLEQTCKLMDSHLRSKEANMRLSQLSWAWFRKNCKQLHNSNIIMSPSIYKGGSRRTDSVHTENSESGNIKYTNEKLWKPIPYWLCCPGLLLVQRVRTNLVSGWHIQEAPKAAAMSWHDEWSRESSWPRTTDKSSFNQILTEHQLTGEKCVVFFFWIETY